MIRPLSICGTVTVIALLLLGHTSAIAGAGSQLIKSEYGAIVDDLQLAVEVNEAGTSAKFHVKNVGAKPITFVEQYSCSGYNHWWLAGGTDKEKLTTFYAYEPSLAGITTKMTTRCTRNGPTNFLTVKPGRVVTVIVPFAKKEPLILSRDGYFQAHASISLRIGPRRARTRHQGPQIKQLESPVVPRKKSTSRPSVAR